nr:PREDICTED: uncharacterized protein LOC103313146 isoform X1 [Tribolium castaneum]|eukprot:XP_008193868.2 PREDICTED: uncharacterized protein LOC103313146 isoform X1 [Tribolium castaneum]
MRQYANLLKKQITEKVFLNKDVKLKDVRRIPSYIKREENIDLDSLKRCNDLETSLRSQGLDLLLLGEDIQYFIEMGNIEAHPKIDFDTYMEIVSPIESKYWVCFFLSTCVCWVACDVLLDLNQYSLWCVEN